MALTLRSSTSFISTALKPSHHKPPTTCDDPPPSTLSFASPHKPLFPPTAISSSRFKAVLRASHHNLGPLPERLHPETKPALRPTHNDHGSTRVPVYVMLPLDTIYKGNDGKGAVNRQRALNASMMALRSAGVEGIMADVWWGLVERDEPMQYDWEGYAELVRMADRNGLKMQMVMSFHQCGGNVGDSCSIPLPPWVQEEMSRDPDIVYTDRSGQRNPEYISLGCDELPVLRGRTPIQVYSDYMRSFRDRFSDYLGNVIVEIQVGLGPCGELRYPSYPESNGTWKFPGIGEFQCYDKYMKASLEASAIAAGQSGWGNGGPHDAGQYNQFPEDTGFFKREGTWNTDYGNFFLGWYSDKLLEHGDRVLTAADSIFSSTGAKLSAKVAGIHWHYRSRSHAAELTAGYYNTRYRDGYVPIAEMLAKRGVIMNFTCMEMKDEQQPGHAGCAPELLVQQVKSAASSAGIELAGENALERYDEAAYAQVLATSRSQTGMGLSAFTYLRLNKNLFDEANWRQFVSFVKAMGEGGRKNTLPRCDSTQSDLYVGFVKKGDRKPEAEAAAAL